MAAKSKPKPKPKAKVRAKPKAKPPAKKPAKRPAKQPAKKPAKKPAKRKVAAPRSKTTRRPRKPQPPVASAAGAVVRILDAERPIDALRDFLADIGDKATTQQGQIALGAAQLVLLPIARESRGGDDVKELLDLLLGRWESFPDRSGFHAQEFLRNAFAAVGDDRARIARLVPLVPLDASPELRFNVACALALAGEREAMLREIDLALASGISAGQFQRERDFAEYVHDPQFQVLLAKAGARIIRVDIRPYTPRVRAALDSLVRTLRELGEKSTLHPPATLDRVLEAERAGKLQLPNDYRALLTISDGLSIWNHQFLGTSDFREPTALANDAREYLSDGLDDCVPLANWGEPREWLLFDPYGKTRGGEPGYVLMHDCEPAPLDDLSHALAQLEHIVRDSLATN